MIDLIYSWLCIVLRILIIYYMITDKMLNVIHIKSSRITIYSYYHTGCMPKIAKI